MDFKRSLVARLSKRPTLCRTMPFSVDHVATVLKLARLIKYKDGSLIEVLSFEVCHKSSLDPNPFAKNIEKVGDWNH